MFPLLSVRPFLSRSMSGRADEVGAGYGILKWAIADNDLRNSKQGHILGKFP